MTADEIARLDRKIDSAVRQQQESESELKADIAMLRAEMLAEFGKVNKRIDGLENSANSLRKNVDLLRKEVELLRKEVDLLREDFNSFPAMIARLLVEHDDKKKKKRK